MRRRRRWAVMAVGIDSGQRTVLDFITFRTVQAAWAWCGQHAHPRSLLLWQPVELTRRYRDQESGHLRPPSREQ